MNAIPSPDRMQNEQWTGFGPTKGAGNYPWVEIGDTIGQIGFGGGSGEHYVTAPVYFWAYWPNANGSGEQEWDMPNGPGLGQWFEASEVAAGGGGWCAKFNNVQVGCGGGFSEYANNVKAGLEVYANIPPENLNNTNSGTVEMYEMNLKGQLYAPSPVSFSAYGGSNGIPHWCYIWPVSGKGNWLDVGTGPPPCGGGGKETNVMQGLERHVTTVSPLEADAAQPTIDVPAPAEGYVAPTGQELSSSQLAKYGLAISSVSGDDPTPSAIEEVSTTLQKASEATSPTFSLPSTTMSAALEHWWDSRVDLLVIHGQFSLGEMPRPAEDTQIPSGTVLDVIVDAHSGAVDSMRVDNTSPATLVHLGPVEEVLR